MALSPPRAGAPLPTGDEKHLAVREMFDRIAPSYDFMNRLMTGGLDRRWRVAALEGIELCARDRVLDVACGTGDLIELARERGADGVGIDFAGEMLRGARQRSGATWLARCDAGRLPFADSSFTVAVSGFALRNFVSLPAVFAELARVVAPGGRIALLDVDRPANPLLRLGHALYFERVVPRLGAWLADGDAYAYLPRSVAYLPEAPVLARWIEDAGFDRVRRQRLALGAVQLWTGVRRAPEAAS